MKVHFIGICGSGQSAIAVLAKNMEYEVDGCDQHVDGYYYDSLIEHDIAVFQGHDISHLDHVDICAVTPAVFDIDPDNREIQRAKELGILMTWQEFMGKYLFQDRPLIGICGTHGKSTTTVMLGKALQELGADPSVISGTIYPEWNSGCRVGRGELTVCESDEFNRNFLNYHPDIIVLNNIEMDHPETYHNFEEMLEAYSLFLRNIKGKKMIVANADSESVMRLLQMNQTWLKEEAIKVFGYTNQENTSEIFHSSWSYQMGEMDYEGTRFSVDEIPGEFMIRLHGSYNVQNAMSVIGVLLALGYEIDKIKNVITMFTGIHRRFDLVGKAQGAYVYDDYAHHPTAIRNLLTMSNQIKKRQVWAVFEPHQISRLLLMFDEFAKALSLADHVIITKTHIGREIHSNLRPIAASRWFQAIGEEKTLYIEDFDQIVAFLKLHIQPEDMVVVIGAGESYQISRKLVK